MTETEWYWHTDETFSLRYALGMFIHVTYHADITYQPGQLISFSPVGHTLPTTDLVKRAMADCLDKAGVMGEPFNIRRCYPAYPDKNNVFMCADVVVNV